MGLAAPSVAEASGGLPSVKADISLADDRRSADHAEPVSPELALVDPVLADRLRAELPEARTGWQADEAPISEPEPEPEPDTKVSTLRLVEPGDRVIAAPPDPAGAFVPRRAAAPVPLPRASTLRRTLVSFAAGAVFASVVVVGVIAEMGESDGPTSATELAGPSAPNTQAPSATASPSPPAAANVPSKPAGTRKAAESKQAPARPRSVTRPAPKAKKTTASTPSASTRRFAWAPVDGAVGYHVELFRGDRQVLRATTKQPVVELAGTWRHEGRAERLTPGSYRWYVWPVFESGRAARAVVQAKLAFP